MNDSKAGSGSGGPSSGGDKKGGGATVIIVAAIAIGAVVLGGPKLKAMFGGASAESADENGAGGAKKKKTRKVKKVVNGEEREVEESVDEATDDGSQPPSDPIERAKWDKQVEERKKHREEKLADYIHDTRLGLETHAMDEQGTSYEGIAKPNIRHERPLSLAKFSTNPNQKDRPANFDDKNQKFALFTGDAYMIYPGTPLSARLSVTQGNPAVGQPGETPAAPIAISVVSARLTKRGTDGKVSVLGDFPINDRGQFGDDAAGDNVYGGVLDTAKVKGITGEVSLNVVFTAAGEKDEYAVSLDWNVIASPHAKIVGPTSDVMNDKGSLDILVSVDVTEAGDYFFQGVLQDQKGQNLAWAEVRPTLEKGKQTVTFPFYGLLFQEKKLDGPYVFALAYGTHIYGEQRNQTMSVPEWTGKYMTKPYKFAQFTNEESQDPARTDRIAMLRDLAVRNPGGISKSGPDFTMDAEGNLVPATGGTPAASTTAVDDTPPLDKNKPYTPDSKIVDKAAAATGGSGDTPKKP